MKEEYVVLVDERDREIGIQEKWQAHVDGNLHRAFSIFLSNSNGEWLLQRRADGKYHSGGLWTNTCCSHPRPQETVLHAAHRRLQEEMGIDCELIPLARLIYRADLNCGLIEHELDHVLIGHYEGDPIPNPEEVSDWKWMDIKLLQADLTLFPEQYTAWLKTLLEKLPQLSRPTQFGAESGEIISSR